MAANETRERILDSAESLFADQGFDGTSLRAITSAAKANIAAVNYHFGSKAALIEQVLARRLHPLNSERLERLEEMERAAGHRTLSVEEILECFFGPALRMSADPDSGGRQVMRLYGRTLTEPGGQIRELFARQFKKVATRFNAALGRALPQLPPEELAWRMHFMIGSMAHTMANEEGLRQLLGRRGERQVDTMLARLIRFAAAGLRAEPGRETRGRRR